MFITNYLKTVFRMLKKQKMFSFINIFGLSIGMAGCIITFLFVQHERSYNLFHEHVDRIFRLQRETFTAAPAFLGPAMATDFPEVEKAIRIENPSEFFGKVTARYKDKCFLEDGFAVGDPAFFEIFSFPLISGNLQQVLSAAFQMVITENTAKKYFGGENPVGKTLLITIDFEHHHQQYEFTITGVMSNTPENSTIQFDMLGSLSSIPDLDKNTSVADEYWTGTYLLLTSKDAIHQLRAKFPAYIKEKMGEQFTSRYKMILKPLSAIHSSETMREIMFGLSLVALIIIIVASINFMNLSTARSLTRVKEIGIRKVVGASRQQLIKQFIGESIIFSFWAFIMAIILVELLLPLFNTISGKQLHLNYLTNPSLIIASILIILGVGTFSGSYPGLVLSAFRPTAIFGGISKTGSKRNPLRTVLVVFQYAVSVFFIIGTLVIFKQNRYIINKDFGFDKENIIVITLQESFSRERLEALKFQLLRHSQAQSVSYATSIPFYGMNTITRKLHHDPNDFSKYRDYINTIYTDENFLKTFGITLKQGQAFSNDYASDYYHGFILNQAAVESFSEQQPVTIGGNVQFSEDEQRMKQAKIIGIVDNFHYHDFHFNVQPLVITVMSPPAHCFYKYITIKIGPGNTQEILNVINDIMHEFSPVAPFKYTFLDEEINNSFKEEKRLMHISVMIMLITLSIASLGLVGLAMFSAHQKTHEIGVRKVLGATVSGVMMLLSKQFLKWVILANILACPIAYFFWNNYLQIFAYRIQISWDLFVITGLATLLIAFITISTQVVKSSLINPVDVLRYE